MGVCVRTVWLDSDKQRERSISSSESRKLLQEAEERAIEHARRIAEQSRHGLDTKPAREFLADFERCVEGVRERVAVEKRRHRRRGSTGQR